MPGFVVSPRLEPRRRPGLVSEGFFLMNRRWNFGRFLTLLRRQSVHFGSERRKSRLGLAGRATSNEERAMGQIFGIVGSGMLFLSFCAYCEARDALQSAAFSFSPSRAKIAGLFAACVTLAIGMVICCLLTMAGTSYGGGL
jgi:hypothetical protein